MTTPPTVTLTRLSRTFGATTALHDVDLTIRPGRITGLLGRNGAGKSTLLSIIAGRRRPTGGQVRVDGGDPFDDARTIQGLCLVGDGGGDNDTDRLAARIHLLDLLRPHFDAGLAHRLLDGFGLDPATRIRVLSRGQRAAAAVSLGLASRSPLTMFDESHLGMDAHNRYAFYDALLADYVTHPRTIVMSTHHVDEVSRLLEDVVILEDGRVRLHQPRDELVGHGAVLTGPTTAVEQVLGDRSPLRVRRLGPMTEVVVHVESLGDLRSAARRVAVDITPIGLQDLFVHLTSKEPA